MKVKASTLKEQRINAELGLIIEKFARAMRNANRAFIAMPPRCQHEDAPNFTTSMEFAWAEYVEFCRTNIDEKA